MSSDFYMRSAIKYHINRTIAHCFILSIEMFI